MKLKILLILLSTPFLACSQVDYNKFFTGSSLRFDFFLGGNNSKTEIYEAQTKKEQFWAGSKNGLISPFSYGSYRFQVYDVKSDILIFSKGFSTLFQEWQTTTEAKEIDKTFYQSAIFPFPKEMVRLEIDSRQWDGSFKNIYKKEIDPKDHFIISESPVPHKTFKIKNNGKQENKVDLVILAEGYTVSEMEKFVDDAKRVSEYLFEEEPFKSESQHFNINAVFTPSVNSGTDIPGEHIFKNTHFNSSFYTFNLPRYLTTSDMKKVYDAASVVPYDHIYVLVNTERYGGGGFYNFVSVCTSDHDLTKEVFVHEFGHGFAGLGDEYYNSTVAYEDFYNLKIEPWEPNLTTLVDFKTKWEKMIDKSTPVPTPRSTKYNKTIGVYEGGGYMNKGIYSPYIDCRMKSNDAGGFCPVCTESIKKTILFYTE